MSVSEEYGRRLGAREAAVARLTKAHERIGTLRLILGVVALLVAWAVLFERAFAPVWLLVPVAAFVALVRATGGGWTSARVGKLRAR